jgi:CBS-domain-containing membrane protein
MQIKDFMTGPVVTVRDDTPLKEAARLLVSHGYNVLPVVDDDGRFLGAISEADLINCQILPDPRTLLGDVPRTSPPAELVADVMSKDPVTVDPTIDAAAIARLMLDRNLYAVPVVDDGWLLGIVARHDVLRTLARDDQDIARDVRGRLRVNCRPAWDIQVANGIVTLTAENTNPGDRRAARIIAAARSGVLAVRIVDPSKTEAA